MKTLSIAVVLILVNANSMLAEEKEPAADAKLKAAAQVKFADANADGNLTLGELRKARSKFLKACIEAGARKDVELAKRLKEEHRDLMTIQDFLAADVDNDRSLAVEQLTDYLALESEHKRWRLSDSDVETVAQEKSNENWEWSISGADADGDLHISRSEGSDKLKSDKDQREFDAADLDGDGTLSQYEYTKVGIERFKLAAKPKVATARAEFGDTVCGEPAGSNNLYQRCGRKWMLKIHITNEEGEFTDYRSEKVVDVTADGATLLTIYYDKDKKPFAGDEKGKEVKTEFTRLDSADNLSAYKDGGVMQSAGRDWRVEVTEYKFGDFNIKSWRSAEMPRLVVRAEAHGGEGEKAWKRVVTLEEFSDGE